MQVLSKRRRPFKGAQALGATDLLLTAEDFAFFQREILKKCGIALASSKFSLVESRLRKRVIELQLSSYSEYRTHLETSAESNLGSKLESNSNLENEWQFVINSLTTHTTEWFREIDHFNELRDVFIPKWLAKKRTRPLRIWSAACSTGKEAYSIALVLNYFQQKTNLEYEIFATDIDTEVLSVAEDAYYSIQDLQKIPKEYHSKALARGINSSHQLMKVRSHIKENVHFSQLNLVDLPYRIPNHFDLIFCRNIFIYFSPSVIEKVANAMFEVAQPGALLLTGHSESFSDLKVEWSFIKPTYYKKPGELL